MGNLDRQQNIEKHSSNPCGGFFLGFRFFFGYERQSFTDGRRGEERIRKVAGFIMLLLEQIFFWKGRSAEKVSCVLLLSAPPVDEPRGIARCQGVFSLATTTAMLVSFALVCGFSLQFR